MLSDACRALVKFGLVALVSILISGCGVTMSPVKRQRLEVFPLETALVPNSQKIFVRFESTLPGKPLSETVWDNVSGAFADIEESQQIGFTQDYTKLAPIVLGGAAGGAIGAIGGAVITVSSETKPDYTRIVIPFGRIFQGVLQPGLQKVFPNSFVCFDDSCEQEKMLPSAPKYVVRLKAAEFQVWEKPLNHLNMKAVIECKVYRADRLDQPEYIYEARREATNQSIGSVMTTSSGFIRAMDKISNEFAAGLSEDILEKLRKKLGN